MKEILIAIAVMVVLGFIFGILISFFASKFKVEEDKRLVEIDSLLPGVNCGMCGFAGCHQLAEKIFELKADESNCKVLKGDPKEKLKEFIKNNLVK